MIVYFFYLKKIHTYKDLALFAHKKKGIMVYVLFYILLYLFKNSSGKFPQVHCHSSNSFF